MHTILHFNTERSCNTEYWILAIYNNITEFWISARTTNVCACVAWYTQSSSSDVVTSSSLRRGRFALDSRAIAQLSTTSWLSLLRDCTSPVALDVTIWSFEVCGRRSPQRCIFCNLRALQPIFCSHVSLALSASARIRHSSALTKRSLKCVSSRCCWSHSGVFNES